MSTSVGFIEKDRRWSITVQWKLNGSPVNITGYTFTCFLQDPGRLNNVTITNGSGITIIDAVNGIFKMALTAAQTSLFSTGAIEFDVKAQASGQDPDTVFEAYATVKDTKTK